MRRAPWIIALSRPPNKLRFLVDAQLPPALARLLSGLGHDASHVFDLGEVAMADGAIWKYAIEHNAVIVTKDSDFKIMASTMPRGARVVLIGLGKPGFDHAGLGATS